MGKEERIRAITKLYYSQPKIQEVLLKFAKDREVVPRYFEGFGKRPDMLMYPSDVIGAVNRGATSFHGSEELWENPLDISSEMTPREFNDLRKGWDLLIDIDSPFFDYSRIAARLMIEELEEHGIKNYGLKFSGSKGFHIIVSWKAFPKEFRNQKTSDMFPEWPRAISEYLTNRIRPKYNREVSKMDINFEALETRTKMKKEDVTESICPECGRPGKKGKIVKFQCPVCALEIERKDPKVTKRRLKCLVNSCPGVFEIAEEKDYFFCEYCETSDWDRMGTTEGSEKFEEGISGNAFASLDLVLVAPRHLFRMPYSLHEKTSLASVVLKKEDLDTFSLGDASPMKVQVREFLPENEEGEARILLAAAVEWKGSREVEEERHIKKKYSTEIKLEGKLEMQDFPKPIKKLMKGLVDGKKRGLFILITFLRAVNYNAEEINKIVREWNEKNEVPLKEGYIRSQVDWHVRQSKKILPPNYSNQSFYKDLGLIDSEQKVKSPLSEAMRKMAKRD